MGQRARVLPQQALVCTHRASRPFRPHARASGRAADPGQVPRADGRTEGAV